MIRHFSDETCAFDCEWVPCVDTGRRLLGLDESTGEREVFELMWQRYRSEEGGDEDAPPQPFLKLALCKVISIAAIIRQRARDGSVELRLFSRGIHECSEGVLIGDFLERVAKKSPQPGWQLWGYNSAGSDLPILKQRAIALGVRCPKFTYRPAKPWEGPDFHDDRNSEAHVDILQVLSGWARGGAVRPKLSEYAAACGIPGKLGISGGQIAGLYLDGRMDDILAYNQMDALTTHLIMLRIANHACRISEEGYEAEIAAVDRLLEAEAGLGRAHMARYRDEWRKTRAVPPG